MCRLQIRITYPEPAKQKKLQLRLMNALKWPFLFAGYICVVMNLVTGGKAWSAIVVWSLWFAWSMAISPALVEYNRISQLVKLIANSCVLLILIDRLLAPGWAVEVVPIVCFCGLAAAGALFFTDLERQQQNMFPMLLLIGFSLLCSVIGLLVWREESRWTLAVMGAFALSLLVGCVSTLGSGFVCELKKRFHTN